MTSFYEEIRKNDSVSDEKENEQSRKNVDKWIFRLLLFLIGFMPLVVLANVEEVISPLISNLDILSSGIKGDLFTHYKSLLVILVTLITGIMLLAKVLLMGGTIRKTKLNYVLGVFVVAIVISTIISPNMTIALNGQYNRSDGAISWLCYVVLMFIAMNIQYPKNVVRYIMYTMMPFVYINLYIITMNFYGKDLMQQTWIQNLVSIALPEGATISAGSQLVGTLNQWNYMSGMFAMMTVMYLAWAVSSQKWIETITGTIAASVSLIILFMSISTSGFLTFLLLLPFILTMCFILKNKKNTIVSIILFLIITVPLFITIAEKDSRVWTESIGFFIDYNPFSTEIVSILNFDNNVSANEEIIVLPEMRERKMGLGTGRVYIWEKTLELVKEHPFGLGADSLLYNFPHFNIDARYGMYDENVIVDKPHNNYIGTLYNFGLIGLIAIITIALFVSKCLFKSIFTKNTSLFIISIATTAYFIQSMFNDSLNGISTLAFTLIGILVFLQNNKQSREV